MKTNKNLILIAVSLALLLFTFYSCKSSTVSEPAPLGPSSIAVMLDVSANPNVIVAGEQDRETAEVTARLTSYDGAPLSGRTLYFEIINLSGRILNLGYFDEKQSMQTIVTDADGTARTTYYGPLQKDLRTNVELYVRATVAWEGSQNIQDTTPIYIVRDYD